MLDEDPRQRQEELDLALGVTCQAISKRLHALGMIQKQGTWVPYDLKPRDVERRFFACEQLLQRQKRKGFFRRIVILCIWWDQVGVIYYELLKPNETITGERYRTQLMRLSRALREKRPQYGQRHEKVILQHDTLGLTLPNPLKPTCKRSNGKSYPTRRIPQKLRRPINTCSGR